MSVLPDLLIIFCIILLLFGAKNLPKGYARAFREFRRARDDFEREIGEPQPPEEAPEAAKWPSDGALLTALLLVIVVALFWAAGAR